MARSRSPSPSTSPAPMPAPPGRVSHWAKVPSPRFCQVHPQPLGLTQAMSCQPSPSRSATAAPGPGSAMYSEVSTPRSAASTDHDEYGASMPVVRGAARGRRPRRAEGAQRGARRQSTRSYPGKSKPRGRRGRAPAVVRSLRHPRDRRRIAGHRGDDGDLVARRGRDERGPGRGRRYRRPGHLASPDSPPSWRTRRPPTSSCWPGSSGTERTGPAAVVSDCRRCGSCSSLSPTP